MAWDDEDNDTSLGGAILRAAATGMLITCLAYGLKAIFGGTAGIAGNLLTMAFSGIVGMACIVGADAADRDCRGAGEEEKAASCRMIDEPTVAVSRPVSRVAEVEASETCERRFVAKLDRGRDRQAGRGV